MLEEKSRNIGREEPHDDLIQTPFFTEEKTQDVAELKGWIFRKWKIES